MPTKWAVPENSRKSIDSAGKKFVSPESSETDKGEARAVINNWRSSHSFPLNTLQVSLRKKAYDADPTALVAQRIKRLPSIQLKLERFPNMKLSQMHDLGGARAVLRDIKTVREVENGFLRSRHKHELSRHDDYIAMPQATGYRGIHLVYKYKSDQKPTYDNLRIEIQVRSALQHAWATAVETVGTFTKQSLKSNRGADDWLRFFALMSGALAHDEGTAFPPGIPPNIEEVHGEIREFAERLSVIQRMEAYQQGLQEIQNTEGGKYTLLQLDIESSVLTISSFRDLKEATAAFDASELALSGVNENHVMQDTVLVSVDSINSLESAYPNYFLDTSVFLEKVRGIINS